MRKYFIIRNYDSSFPRNYLIGWEDESGIINVNSEEHVTFDVAETYVNAKNTLLEGNE